MTDPEIDEYWENRIRKRRVFMARCFVLRRMGWTYREIGEWAGVNGATIQARLARYERRIEKELRAWRAGLRLWSYKAVLPEVCDDGDSHTGEWTPEMQYREFNENR
jgi:hypothetical protein